MAAHTNSKNPLPLSTAHVNVLLAGVLQIASSRWREDEDASKRTRSPAPTLASVATTFATRHAAAPASGASAVGESAATSTREKVVEECGAEGEAPDACHVLASAILIRAAYGGMPGDVEMLQTAAHVWASRAPGTDAAPLSPATQQADNAWAPRLRDAFAPSPLVVALVEEALGGGVASPSPSAPALEVELRLAMRGEGGLRWEDVPLSSIDFHCSRVLDAALSQPTVRHEMESLLSLSSGHGSEQLESLAKQVPSSTNHVHPTLVVV